MTLMVFNGTFMVLLKEALTGNFENRWPARKIENPDNLAEGHFWRTISENIIVTFWKKNFREIKPPWPSFASLIMQKSRSKLTKFCALVWKQFITP